MLRSFRERFGESLDAFKAVVTNPALRRIELSWAASITAYWAFIIALAVYAYDEGGAAAVGLDQLTTEAGLADWYDGL